MTTAGAAGRPRPVVVASSHDAAPIDPTEETQPMSSSPAAQAGTALTTAERRAVQQITTSDGRFAVIAADHGQPLVDMLDALGRSSAPAEQRAFKADLVDTVGRDASAVLLDPDVSLPDVVDRGLLGRDVGLLVRIEADGHETVGGLRRSGLIDGLGAEGARARGATAAKVMVFLRADREELDGPTAELVRRALQDCRRADLLCVIELMTYRLDDESPEAFAARKEDLVVEGAVFLQECGSKVLKLEYPGSAEACGRVTDAIAVPWAVLSAGVDHAAFCDQLRAAMAGGADGFIAGRSLWKEAVGQPPADRRRFLDGVARRRLDELLAIVDASG
jgi:sulfofructosephosphate aldolase